MHADTIIYNIKAIYTQNQVAPVKGKDMRNITIIENPYIAIQGDKILRIGHGDYQELIGEKTILHDAQNAVVLPGLIDSHTHLVHGGSREHEFKMKLEGVDYMDILKQGGGILNTVEQTRNSSFKELLKQARKSLYNMLSFGVTVIEAKSGYGLNLETEIKQLEVASYLNESLRCPDIVPTYLGAHALPKEYKGNKKGYVDSVIKDLEVIKDRRLAEYVDVFCEDHVFTIEETRRILQKANELGLKTRLHADEIVALGGAGLAVEMGSASADHLMAIKDEDIKKIASSTTIANILPSTSFYLNKDYAPARKMIDNGCALAISSDYNPGSSPSENLQFSMQLAAIKCRMTPEEILTAVTKNAAYSLHYDDMVGSVEEGKHADIILLDIPNLEYMVYHFGSNHVRDVFKNGQLVIKDQCVV